MNLTLQTNPGFTEAVIDANAGLKRFYQVASLLTETFAVSFTNKVDDFDTISWEFQLINYNLTLEYSIYNGILLFPTKGPKARRRENEAVVQLANVLQGKLLKVNTSKF